MGSAVLNTFFHVPVVGWAIKDALRGRRNAGWWLFLDCVLAVVLAVMTFGYAAVIVSALALTAAALLTLVLLTAGV
jgi:hypothetical protein